MKAAFGFGYGSGVPEKSTCPKHDCNRYAPARGAHASALLQKSLAEEHLGDSRCLIDCSIAPELLHELQLCSTPRFAQGLSLRCA